MSQTTRRGWQKGRKRKPAGADKPNVLSQRYTDTEKRTLESVAGRDVGQFIHDAAVDRAQQFADNVTEQLLENAGAFGMKVIEPGEQS